MQIYVGGAELSEVTVADDALTGHVRSSDESGPWHPPNWPLSILTRAGGPST